MYRRTPSLELVSTAYYEAGHAVAIVAAFRNAGWLPRAPPALPVRCVEITEEASGQWSGCCFGSDIYSMKWPIECIAPRYRDLMERQVVIELAGGIAEAIFRGERRGREVLAFAMRHCDMDGDLQRAADVLAELRRLTGYLFEPRDFVDRSLTMMLEHWLAVTALATELVDDRRIEGDRVEQIIAL